MVDKEKELVELDAKEVDSDIEKEGVDIDSNTPKPKEEKKVELDLDDAPFLEEEEEEEPEEVVEKVEEEKEVEKETEEEKEEPTKKKKKIILIAIIALVGLLCVALIFFFIGRGQKKEKKKELPPKSVAVKEKPPPNPKTFQLALRPFWIDYKIDNGHRYLHLSLLVEYTDGRLSWEFRRKGIVIRDAIYYYLKNKDFSFFLDKRNLSVLKKEIMTIIDQYLVYGKIKRIYLQNYLIE